MDVLKSAKPVILVLAAGCFALAALRVSHPRIDFGWLGAFLVAVDLLF